MDVAKIPLYRSIPRERIFLSYTAEESIPQRDSHLTTETSKPLAWRAQQTTPEFKRRRLYRTGVEQKEGTRWWSDGENMSVDILRTDE